MYKLLQLIIFIAISSNLYSQNTDCNIDSIVISKKLVFEMNKIIGSTESNSDLLKRPISCTELFLMLDKRSDNELIKLQLDPAWEVLIYPCNNCEN
jgi:hypothetical protein